MPQLGSVRCDKKCAKGVWERYSFTSVRACSEVTLASSEHCCVGTQPRPSEVKLTCRDGQSLANCREMARNSMEAHPHKLWLWACSVLWAGKSTFWVGFFIQEASKLTQLSIFSKLNQCGGESPGIEWNEACRGAGTILKNKAVSSVRQGLGPSRAFLTAKAPQPSS